jgi:hypothetical protein
MYIYLNDISFKESVIKRTQHIFDKENHELLEYIKYRDKSSIDLAKISSDLVEEFDERLSRVSEIPGYPDLKIDMKQDMQQAAIHILKEITVKIPTFTNHIINNEGLSKPEARKTSNKDQDTTPEPSKKLKRYASPLAECLTSKKQKGCSPCNNNNLPLSQYYNKRKDSDIVR